jgi:hypothetical protein
MAHIPLTKNMRPKIHLPGFRRLPHRHGPATTLESVHSWTRRISPTRTFRSQTLPFRLFHRTATETGPQPSTPSLMYRELRVYPRLFSQNKMRMRKWTQNSISSCNHRHLSCTMPCHRMHRTMTKVPPFEHLPLPSLAAYPSTPLCAASLITKLSWFTFFSKFLSLPTYITVPSHPIPFPFPGF